ncbi:hypothetical protein BD289DRAFT_170044 [Coniella lustricola]|uniref:Transmembrane protein n=1 Tax=Coniella lustricola TaxID=2025994 RepID=A0A2T3ADW7_9PEZI|nr:hypothetical protein BD289DRAFT_170044 [Coniella lustricola]
MLPLPVSPSALLAPLFCFHFHFRPFCLVLFALPRQSDFRRNARLSSTRFHASITASAASLCCLLVSFFFTLVFSSSRCFSPLSFIFFFPFFLLFLLLAVWPLQSVVTTTTPCGLFFFDSFLPSFHFGHGSGPRRTTVVLPRVTTIHFEPRKKFDNSDAGRQ